MDVFFASYDYEILQSAYNGFYFGVVAVADYDYFVALLLKFDRFSLEAFYQYACCVYDI